MRPGQKFSHRFVSNFDHKTQEIAKKREEIKNRKFGMTSYYEHENKIFRSPLHCANQ